MINRQIKLHFGTRNKNDLRTVSEEEMIIRCPLSRIKRWMTAIGRTHATLKTLNLKPGIEVECFFSWTNPGKFRIARGGLHSRSRASSFNS